MSRAIEGRLLRNSLSAGLNNMLDLNIAPFALQILRHKAAVTVSGRILAAKQARAFQKSTRHFVLDLPRDHQVYELALIEVPVSLALLIFIQHSLRRREFGEVHIIDVADRAQKIAKVIALSKACKLRDVVQPHIHQPAHACELQFGEEGLGRLLRKTDRENLHRGNLRGGP